MSNARTLQDRLTEAVRAKDLDAILACYSPDAVMVAPEGTFHGTDEIALFLRAQFEAFADFDVAVSAKLDGGDTALDEGTFSGTHTGPLPLPNGEIAEPTRKRVTQRAVDAVVARDGLIVEHRLYYDQVEVLTQLGLGTPGLAPAG